MLYRFAQAGVKFTAIYNMCHCTTLNFFFFGDVFVAVVFRQDFCCCGRLRDFIESHEVD